MLLGTPLIIINCKTYGEITGILAEKIARSSVEVLSLRRGSGLKKVMIALAVPNLDLYRLASMGLVPIIAQHIDPFEPGAHTGKEIAQDISYNGGMGVLINHSEDPATPTTIANEVEKARQHRLQSIVCAPTPHFAHDFSRFQPDFIAMEPPELIGGDISVSTAKPDIIKETIKLVHEVADIPVLVGAGVKNAQDVRIARQLGARGVLVASGVALAKNPTAALLDLASGFDK